MPRVTYSRLLLRLLAVFPLLATTPAWADPPARVGRLAFVQGAVSIEEPGAPEWVPAGLNTPVAAGDVLWTAPGSRAELRIGRITVRLDGATELSIDALDYAGLSAQLEQGTISVRLPRETSGEHFVFNAGDASLELHPGGDYDIAADPGAAGPVRVSAFAGGADVSVGGSRLALTTGSAVRIGGGTGSVSLGVEPAVETTFDAWNRARDRAEEAPPAMVEYVSPEMTGAEVLAGAGVWHQEADYGPVWYPTAVPAGWAPYRYGHWRYVVPWGWTWIDRAPW